MIHEAEYETQAGHDALQELHTKIEALAYTLPPVSFWFQDFLLWCNGTQNVPFCAVNATNIDAFLASHVHYKAPDPHPVYLSPPPALILT